MTNNAIFETNIDNLELLARGKVRDIYAIDDAHMLIVTTDRLSAFDVVFAEPIPHKGELLTEVSNFWFAKTAGLVRNHLSDLDLRDYVSEEDYLRLKDRSILVKRLETMPVEAIVRGYVIGSGWRDYQASGEICGIKLPPDLQQAAKLGADKANQIREKSIQLYQLAADYALERGIIIADTKFEFGVDADDELVLIDEILTPDSSRYWPADEYRVGISPPSFDKQFLRDYLETLDWDKMPPAPTIPAELIAKTQQKYQQVRDILLG
jgi:phosphoribosylaminoimidazole-succinocarboxamide synthase